MKFGSLVALGLVSTLLHFTGGPKNWNELNIYCVLHKTMHNNAVIFVQLVLWTTHYNNEKSQLNIFVNYIKKK
jgi:hypothetical protein